MAIRHGARDAIARAAIELANVAPFSELSPVDRARLAAALQQVTFKAGDVIYAQGAPADALYILREGVVERQANGVSLEILEPPAVFGDLALLRDEVRATTLQAVTDATLWRLPGERFTRLAQRTPAIATFFAASMGSHLALRMQEVAELSQEYQGMAQHLYSGLSRSQQETLERAALLPTLDQRVLATQPSALPLADVLLDADAQAYPPAFRRFLLAQMTEREGRRRVADTRRELAARARQVGAHELAVQVLLEGDLVAEALELVDREVGELPSDEAATLVRLLPPDALNQYPHLRDVQSALAEAADPDALDQPLKTATGRRRWPLSRKTTAMLISAILLVGTWPLPPPEGLSDRGWHALTALIASLPLFAVEALPDGIVALLLVAVWVVGGVTTPKTALGGFATTQWALVVSTLAVGVAIAASGLLYRMALWVVANSRGGYVGQVLGLGIAGMVVGPAAPNATSRVALVAPAVTELVDALGLRPYSRAAIGLAMIVLIGFGQVVALFLTSSTTSVLVYAVLPDATRESVSWGSWVARALPTHVVLFGLMAAFILWRYRPRRSETESSGAVNAESRLALQRALLGPPSRHEKIAIGVTVFLLVGFSTQPLHHVDPAWIGVIALAILAATGLLTGSGLGAVNWSFVLLSGVLTSMSDVFSDTGLDTWLAALATQAIGGLSSSPVLFVAALVILCFALSLVMRWQAAAPLLTISLAPVGQSAGIDPWVVGLIALMACNGFFLPYQSTTYLALYHGTNGRLFSHRQARPTAIAYGVVTLLALCASVPFWRVLGLV